MGERMYGNVYFKIKNLGNLINSDWGKVTDAQFFPQEIIRDIDTCVGCPFQFEEFSEESLQRTYVNPSLWEARLGIDIRFGG